MYAVIELGGKQHRVEQGQWFLAEVAEGAVPEPRVLMTVDGSKVVTDPAKLEKVTVKLTTGETVRTRLPRTMKFKPKKGRSSKRTMGHRRIRVKFTVDQLTSGS